MKCAHIAQRLPFTGIWTDLESCGAMMSGMISEGDSCGGRGDSQAVFVCCFLEN